MPLYYLDKQYIYLVNTSMYCVSECVKNCTPLPKYNLLYRLRGNDSIYLFSITISVFNKLVAIK